MEQVNLVSLLFAGFAAGYLMAFADEWLKGFLGLFGVFPGLENTRWLVFHQIDSILFAIPFAWWAGRSAYAPLWLAGAIYGVIWWLLSVIFAVIARVGGAERMRGRQMPARAVVSNFLLHAVWGFFVGLLYVRLVGM